MSPPPKSSAAWGCGGSNGMRPCTSEKVIADLNDGQCTGTAFAGYLDPLS